MIGAFVSIGNGSDVGSSPPPSTAMLGAFESPPDGRVDGSVVVVGLGDTDGNMTGGSTGDPTGANGGNDSPAIMGAGVGCATFGVVDGSELGRMLGRELRVGTAVFALGSLLGRRLVVGIAVLALGSLLGRRLVVGIAVLAIGALLGRKLAEGAAVFALGSLLGRGLALGDLDDNDGSDDG